MQKFKSILLVIITIASLLTLLPAIHQANASSSPPDLITKTTVSTGTLPESSQRVFQNSRGTMANYVFYSTPGAMGTCYYAYSIDGVTWTKDQSTTLGTSFPICSITYREDSVNSRTVVYVVGSKVSDGVVGASHSILFNIGTIADSASSISWVNTTPQTLFSAGSTQATEYPVVIIDAKGYLLVAFSFVNDAGGTNNDAQNVVVCGSGTKFPVSNPSWTCSSTAKSCTLGTNCPFANSGTNEGNVRDAKYMPQLIPNVSGYDALILRGTCEGSESITCHGQNTATEASNTVSWTGTTLSFGTTPATFNLPTPSQDPADQRSVTILSNSGVVYLAYANGTSSPLGGYEVQFTQIAPSYTAWSSPNLLFTQVFSKGLHLTVDANTRTVYLLYTIQANSIGIFPINGGSSGNFYQNTTYAPNWVTSPTIINNQTNTTNEEFAIPVSWVNEAPTPELWFGRASSRITPVFSNTSTASAMESTVDVNPTNSQNIVTTGSLSVLGNYSTLVAFTYTKDGGKTWAQGITRLPCPLNSCTQFNDPTGTFDGSGNYFFAGFDNNTGIGIAKSTDGGASASLLSAQAFAASSTFSWSNGTNVQVCPPSRAGSIMVDHPRIIADKSPTSPYENNLYILSEFVPFNLNPSSCWNSTGWGFQRSTDGGATWTSGQGWAYGFVGQPQESDMDVSVNGTIYIASTTSNDCSTGVKLLKSTNGGQSFSSSCVLSNLNLNQISRGSPVASKKDGSTLYFVYQSCESFNTPCPNPDHVYAVKSTDAGATWGSSVRVDDILSPDNSQQPINLVAHVSTSGRLDISWYDRRNSGGNQTLADMYYSYSADGSTFSQNMRLTSSTGFWCGSWFTNPVRCSTGNDYQDITSDPNTPTLVYSCFGLATPIPFVGGKSIFNIQVSIVNLSGQAS